MTFIESVLPAPSALRQLGRFSSCGLRWRKGGWYAASRSVPQDTTRFCRNAVEAPV